MPVANIETSTLNARRELESIKVGLLRASFSLDVRSLYTNVPVNEAIELALSKLYNSDQVHEMPTSTLKTLLKLAVTKISFKCNDRWFCQVDGLAMGASLAESLAINWTSFEHQIKSTEKIINKVLKKELEACPECNRRVTYRGKRIECEKWEIWCHAKRQNIDDQLYAKMKDMVWYFSNCQKIKKLDSEPETERQLFER